MGGALPTRGPDTVLKNLQTASDSVRTAARRRKLLEQQASGVGVWGGCSPPGAMNRVPGPAG